MTTMFWVWLGIIIVSAVIEAITLEFVSGWFTIGAIVPFILATAGNKSWELQLIIFIVVSALLIIFLRKITKRFLLRNANEKTNTDSMVGMQVRMLSKTDFETIGSVRVNDVVWSAISETRETEIEKNEIVEIIKISGNKLIVKKVSKPTTEKTEVQVKVSEETPKSKEKDTEEKTKIKNKKSSTKTKKSNK